MLLKSRNTVFSLISFYFSSWYQHVVWLQSLSCFLCGSWIFSLTWLSCFLLSWISSVSSSESAWFKLPWQYFGPSRKTPHCSNGRIILYWIADFYLFPFVQIWRGCRCIVGLLFKKVGKVPTIKMNSDKSFYRQLLQLEANVNFQTVVVALAACLYWDEFDIKAGTGWKNSPKNSAMLCQSMRL